MLHHYMGTSTFANFTVVPEIAVAKIRIDAPFDKVCYIGCGVTTGVGAVINTAQVRPGDRVVVFGLGGIGLNVVQGCRMVGADMIVGIDVNPARCALAERFGLTHFVNPTEVGVDLVAHLVALTDGGADFSFECIGNVQTVMALSGPGALEAVAQSDAALCLMHMQGEPQTMQAAPHYEDVVAEVRAFLARRIAACEAAGIARSRLVIDPGFGSGKTLAHNLALLKNLDRLAELGVPMLAGMSRKSMLGALTGKPVEQREYAGIAAHLAAVAGGAAIVRVHDVAAMKDALTVWLAVEGAE